jgi:membrane-bound lytic murein transglycosylase A
MPGAVLATSSFEALPGWADDRHDLAFQAFRKGCAAQQSLRNALAPPPSLAAVCAAALALAPPGPAEARAFFERWFRPWQIRPGQGQGFLTGYFEPAFPGSLQPAPGYPVPLYGRPANLVTLEPGAPRPAVLEGLQAAMRQPDGALAPAPTRRDIDETAVAEGWPVIAWLRDPVDRFVMQVQGSARLSLAGGQVARVAYAGRNGHPYVSLGRLLSEREAIPPAQMTMDRLVARLKADAGWGRALIWNNPSFVFFRLADELDPADGPIGGAGIPLTPHRSIAADRGLWPYGLPAWLDGQVPTPLRGESETLRRLVVIQDTGSAIVGPARFDLFYGSGDEAGFVAGLTRHAVTAYVLWPHTDGP